MGMSWFIKKKKLAEEKKLRSHLDGKVGDRGKELELRKFKRKRREGIKLGRGRGRGHGKERKVVREQSSLGSQLEY